MLEFVKVRLRSLIADRKGISSLEYAVMAVGIVGTVALAATTLGQDISTGLLVIGSYISGITMS